MLFGARLPSIRVLAELGHGVDAGALPRGVVDETAGTSVVHGALARGARMPSFRARDLHGCGEAGAQTLPDRAAEGRREASDVGVRELAVMERGVPEQHTLH
jgi:hypothetical protein